MYGWQYETEEGEGDVSKLTVSGIVKALREGFTHGYVTSEIGAQHTVRFSVLANVSGDDFLFCADFPIKHILAFSGAPSEFTKPILDRWHRYMTLSKEELEKADGVLHVPMLGPSLAETTDG